MRGKSHKISSQLHLVLAYRWQKLTAEADWLNPVGRPPAKRGKTAPNSGPAVGPGFTARILAESTDYAVINLVSLRPPCLNSSHSFIIVRPASSPSASSAIGLLTANHSLNLSSSEEAVFQQVRYSLKIRVLVLICLLSDHGLLGKPHQRCQIVDDDAKRTNSTRPSASRIRLPPLQHLRPTMGKLILPSRSAAA